MDFRIQIRKAKKSDLEWIDERYDEVEFLHSSFENEFIAIAEIEGHKTGISRAETKNQGRFFVSKNKILDPSFSLYY